MEAQERNRKFNDTLDLLKISNCWGIGPSGFYPLTTDHESEECEERQALVERDAEAHGGRATLIEKLNSTFEAI